MGMKYTSRASEDGWRKFEEKGEELSFVCCFSFLSFSPIFLSISLASLLSTDVSTVKRKCLPNFLWSNLQAGLPACA